MAQEFTINSSAIETKINQLLPSQGGFGAGVDFSASTMVVPIVDLTESAEGSEVRADLQTALSHGTITSFNVSDGTTTIVSTTGYYRVFGSATTRPYGANVNFAVTDGVTSKILIDFATATATVTTISTNNTYDFIVFLSSGESLTATSSSGNFALMGCTRQIADINGNLTDP